MASQLELGCLSSINMEVYGNFIVLALDLPESKLLVWNIVDSNWKIRTFSTDTDINFLYREVRQDPSIVLTLIYWKQYVGNDYYWGGPEL